MYLTLVSIVVALGLEQLLNHVSSTGADGTGAYLVLVQALAMFLVLATIWLIYAVLLMAAPWTPRFQDFFVPLLLLVVLYFTISAIGGHPFIWFYLIGFGSLAGTTVAQQNFKAANVNPTAAAKASPILLCHIGLTVIGFGSGVAAHAQLIENIGSIILAGMFSVGQLYGAWLVFQWWRAA